MDSINGISYYLNKCQTLLDTSQMTFFSSRKTAHWCTCIVHATRSNYCGSLDFLSLFCQVVQKYTLFEVA